MSMIDNYNNHDITDPNFQTKRIEMTRGATSSLSYKR